MEFARSTKRFRELQLTPMIDVSFILIVFFMLTTSFMKIESMELLLPSSGAKAKFSDSISRVYLLNDDGILLNDQTLDRAGLRKTLKSLLNANPEQRIMVLTSSKVSVQSMVDIMDMVYTLGGRNVFVKGWNEGAATQ